MLLDLVGWFFETGIFSLVLSIVAGVISGLVVTVLMKTRADKIFDKNAKIVYGDLFSHIDRIDAYKENMFRLWQPRLRNNGSAKIVLEPHIYREIRQLRSLILKEVEYMSLYRNSPYVSLSEYLLLQQYALSAYSHLTEISNVEDEASVNEKSLEHHMFYAKEIIENLPKRVVPKHFVYKWDQEFQRRGGIQAVRRPLMEPGDSFGSYHNFNNEVRYFDAQYVSIIKALNDIKDAVSRQNA